MTDLSATPLPTDFEPTTVADLSGLDEVNASEGLSTDSRSPARLALGRFRRNWVAMIALVLLTIVVLACLFPSIPARYGETERLPVTDTTFINSPPSAQAWFGTDDLNRDLYSRIFYGGRVSIIIGISVALIACTVGAIVGAIAGYRGGKFDDVLMRITDVFLAFPILVSLLVLRNVLAEIPGISSIMGEKSSTRFMVILLAVVSWMAVARIVFRHLIPNALGPIMVALSLAVVGAILAESTLSFFGYGPSPGEGKTTWGLLIGPSKRTILSGYWWLVVFPCLFLVITIVCINFVGDGLRDSFDPKANKDRA